MSSVADVLKAKAAAALAESQGDGIDRGVLVPLTAVQQPTAAVIPSAVIPESDAPKELGDGVRVAEELRHSRKFVHQTAGANTIMPDGKKLTFGGRPHLASIGMVGGIGLYITSIPEEIKWLSTLAKMPGSQVTELIEDVVTHQEMLVQKKVDPAIALSARDAAANSERVMNPNTSAVVENMGAHIASGMAADSQRPQ